MSHHDPYSDHQLTVCRSPIPPSVTISPLSPVCGGFSLNAQLAEQGIAFISMTDNISIAEVLHAPAKPIDLPDQAVSGILPSMGLQNLRECAPALEK